MDRPVLGLYLNIKNNATDERGAILNSPDVMHRRVLAMHQSVLQMSNDIDKRNALCLEETQVNNLDSFRKIAAQKNQMIYFPPIKK